MEYDKQITYMLPGDEVEGFYLLKQAAVKTASNGSRYLNAVLGDASGKIEAKVWDYSGPLGQADEGKIVKIRGEVGEFKGSLQLNVKKIRPASPEDSYNIADIVPTAPIDSVKELEFIRDLISSFEDEDYRSICEYMLDRHITAFGRIPAAKSIHHSFLCGLLMHTANMLRIADFLAVNIYPETVNRDLLLAGTLLHDFAKEREFALDDLGTVAGSTVEGMLLGHLVLGSEEIAEVGRELGVQEEKTVLLRHMLLSHHGKPEFGAAVLPCIAEAELLSHIDMLDSRMEIYAENYERMSAGETSDRIFSLEKRIYNHE